MFHSPLLIEKIALNTDYRLKKEMLACLEQFQLTIKVSSFFVKHYLFKENSGEQFVLVQFNNTQDKKIICFQDFKLNTH